MSRYSTVERVVVLLALGFAVACGPARSGGSSKCEDATDCDDDEICYRSDPDDEKGKCRDPDSIGSNNPVNNNPINNNPVNNNPVNNNPVNNNPVNNNPINNNPVNNNPENCPAAQDCAGRECGADPVCGLSCGGCDEGEMCQGGSCEPGGANRAPRILTLGSNISQMDPGDTLIISAVVTDPDGIDDLIGGTLSDPSGGTYGSFSTSAGEGSYELRLSWSQINSVRRIDAPEGGATRTFRASFYDVAGVQATMDLSITLDCGASQATCGGGECIDLSGSDNCGACGNSCGEAADTLAQREADLYIVNCEETGCRIAISQYQPTMSCSEYCSEGGLRCGGQLTDVIEPACTTGSCYYDSLETGDWLAIACNTRPPVEENADTSLFCNCIQ